LADVFRTGFNDLVDTSTSIGETTMANTAVDVLNTIKSPTAAAAVYPFDTGTDEFSCTVTLARLKNRKL
jgi:hypothetical protein